jgi:hypothetical protein
MGLVSAQLLIAVIPAAAEPRCAEMPLLHTLEAEAKAGKPASEVVEALLRDAEKIYTEKRPNRHVETANGKAKQYDLNELPHCRLSLSGRLFIGIKSRGA